MSRTADKTLASLLGTSFNKVANLLTGACNTLAISPYASSLDGNFAKISIPDNFKNGELLNMIVTGHNDYGLTGKVIV